MAETAQTPQASRTQALEREIEKSLVSLDGSGELMARMVRYSLGLVNSQGEPTDAESREGIQGKRIRPQIAMMVAEAVGGNLDAAAPVAAAIELLHNFTLIHDDIQDRSPNRRHRPTVWRIWGDAQAINAGDALFAVCHLCLLETAPYVTPAALRQLIERFNRCTIEIVRGQVLDINNEGRADVTPDDYLEMIAGKTAAILKFSAWAGAVVGGADERTASRLGDMALAIGMGFQIRDDMLGIWSPVEETGKGADDLRRRKQTLPVLILRAKASQEDSERIAHIYGQESMTDDSIAEMLALMETYGVEADTLTHVEAEHQKAMDIADEVFAGNESAAVHDLRALITQLNSRSF